MLPSAVEVKPMLARGEGRSPEGDNAVHIDVFWLKEYISSRLVPDNASQG
jgi:hypothetical protein